MSGSGSNDEPARARPVPLFTRCIATGFFAGTIPWASGTFGTLLGLVICLLPGVHGTGILLPLIVVFFFAGVHAAGAVARAEGGRLTRSAAAAKAVFQPGPQAHPDPSVVVIDEIVGIWIALLAIPHTVSAFVLCFLAFRIFDVLKPEPARWVEQLPGGWGIMLDDVAAGLYANVTVRVLLFLLPIIAGPGWLP
jgi:phosphatidylglycerophosphatase A